MTVTGRRRLLAIVELGGYPNFAPLYERAGYAVSTIVSMRKALAALKQWAAASAVPAHAALAHPCAAPDVIVAEFNFQSDFRDRTSSLESLLAVVQRHPQTKVIVFYDKEQAHQLARLQAQHPVFAALAYPVIEAQLEDCLRRASA
jgi:DNA-binding NarL/FixJ family response regulator